tara:strand:- start:892 stop:1410 length:519 start_codon:yes stop_codon:yes gene_type:complete
MAKTKISEYDATAGNNTDIDSVNIAEGCPPSGINNAIRELMAHLKDFQQGSGSDTLTVGNTLTVTADGTFSGTGQLKVPSGTTAQRSGSPAVGMIRHNSTTNSFEGYNNGAWGNLGGGATGGGSDEVFVENDQTVTTNYTITTNRNAMSTGPVTINSGVTVTVPSGSTYVIL